MLSEHVNVLKITKALLLLSLLMYIIKFSLRYMDLVP